MNARELVRMEHALKLLGGGTFDQCSADVRYYVFAIAGRLVRIMDAIRKGDV